MDETLAKALEILRLAALQERGEVYFWHAESPNRSSEGWPAIEICSTGFGRGSGDLADKLLASTREIQVAPFPV